MTASTKALDAFVQIAKDIKTAITRVGDINALQTNDKSNVVNAINEIQASGGGTAQLSTQQLKDFEQMRRYAGTKGAFEEVAFTVTKDTHAPTSKLVSLSVAVSSWHTTASPSTKLLIDWGDGQTEAIDITTATTSFSHTYATIGSYTVSVKTDDPYKGVSSAKTVAYTIISASNPSPTTWTITQSSVYSGTSAATQANMHSNSGTYPAGCYTNPDSPFSHMTAMFSSISSVTTVRIKASTSGGGWGAGYLNGATLQYTLDGTAWVDIVTLSGHATGESTFKDYQVNQNCEGIRVINSGWLAIGQFTVV